MSSNKKKLPGFLIPMGIAVLLALPIALSQGLSLDGAASENCGALSDGFFISGMLLTGVGSLIWISNTGFFDLLSYGVKSIAVIFMPSKRNEAFPKYYDYKCEQDEKREGKPVSYTVLIVGLIALALSALFLVLYFCLSPAM